MEKHIHLFNTQAEFEAAYNGSEYKEPWLSYIEENDRSNFNDNTDYLSMPLTFEILSDGVIKWRAYNTANTKTIKYKKNDDNWVEITSNNAANAPSISVSSGDVVQFVGDNTSYSNTSYYNTFSGTTCQFNLKGNIMSLIDSTNFKNIESFRGERVFSHLFYYCTTLKNARKLILPISTLSSYCYESMFNGCTNLTVAPELPATTISGYCYANMFNGCTNLTTAPELPATTLYGSRCYWAMFQNCTNLTKAPELPSTTLASNCYECMFKGCTNLTTAPELPATTLATYCYTEMFYGCTNLTTAPELPATTLANNCYSGMFRECTNLAASPELPATTLKSSCYEQMFEDTNVIPDCSNIDFTSESVVKSGGLIGLFYGTKITDNDLYDILPKNQNNKVCLPVTSLSGSCYRYMFSECTNLTTAPELPATTMATYCYGSMFNGCTNLTTAPELPATTMATYCYSCMFGGCRTLRTAPELPATTLATGCYQRMFEYCRNLTTAPELPATTLGGYCYQNMFYACSNLTTAPELPATTLADSCYRQMFNTCSKLTTAPELPATTLVSNCYNGMFGYCRNLTYIKAMFIELTPTNATTNWVTSVASEGTFVKNASATWTTTGGNGVPTGWTVETANS